MATKTVINTNMPQTRGISIIVDQDQLLLQRRQQIQQQQQGKQHERMKQELVVNGEPKIRIYQQNIDISNTTTIPNVTKSTTTTTATTITAATYEEEEGDASTKMSLTSQAIPPNKSTTFMHGRIYNDADVDVDDDAGDGDRKSGKETSYTNTSTNDTIITNVATTPLQKCTVNTTATDSTAATITTTTTTTEMGYSHLRLTVGSASSQDDLKTTTMATNMNATKESSERLKTTAELDLELAGKSQATTPTPSSHSGVAAEHNHDDDHQVSNNDESNGINNNNNNNNKNIKNDSDGKSASQHNGQSWHVCMGDLDGQSRPVQLEKVCCVATANSLSTKADCASGALTESKTSAVKDNSHVVKIHIQSNHQQQHQQLEIVQQANKPTEKQVTVVKLNEEIRSNSDLSVSALDVADALVASDNLQLSLDKMVQKSQSVHCAGAVNGVANLATAGTASGATVTELNVNNPNYLYYMMSSGQFSPCDTLDSGTGSDLESNGNTSNGTVQGGVNVPKLEIHLKTTKIRLNGNSGKLLDTQNRNNEHQRASSLTDSEESESSSLSCDSLHSSEFMRQPVKAKSLASTTTKSASAKTALGTFLPDSLLRDIRGRKFLNEDDDPYENLRHSPEAIIEPEYVKLQPAPCRQLNLNVAKRTSLPSKTFVINQEDGSFVDTKLNSIPRRYEADKFYNFHVKEHENFRSFGNNSINGDTSSPDDSISESCFDTKSLHDDAFAGYKDIRCGSATSTIRSSKGTVRGVKNRVRNGIATFLQLQQPNGKVSH